VAVTADRALACRRITLAYGANRVLEDLDLDVAPGETLALLGPSGSGKTSLLFAIAGFLAPVAGEIRIGSRLVSAPGVQVPPERRGVAMVFQHYALWPHLSALETVAYPMRREGVGQGEAQRRARGLLATMGIADLADRRPAELSGGEQQRVGVARALARSAGLLLLDEPTAHLDTSLRVAFAAQLMAARQQSRAAAIYATHDVGEALALADRVALLGERRLIGVGTPRELYERPTHLEAARLSGPVSLLDLTILAADAQTVQVRLGDRVLRVRLAGQGPAPALGDLPGPARLIVRPDWAGLGGELPGSLHAAWYRGPHTDYQISTAAGDLLLREPGPPRAQPGDAVGWHIDQAWPLPSPAGLSSSGSSSRRP
jgi:ABC-type Fe3+/spermidine/putrescine transport system ATPase subunit